jgi:low affinity Fe/Cu permease
MNLRHIRFCSILHSMRSRVAGLRLSVSFGISCAAVWALGPFVKASGFATLITIMAAIAVVVTIAVTFLPNHDPVPQTQ